MKKTLLLAFTIYISLFTYGQTNFFDGYIVTLEGDTIKGQVYLGGSIKQAKECKFIQEGNKKKQRFTSFDIAGYGINGKRQFISMEYEGNNIFAEVIFDGIYDLYFLKSNSKTWLIGRNKENLIDLETSNTVHPVYKGKLQYILSDVPELQSDIQEFSKVSAQNFVELLTNYHEIKDSIEQIKFHRSKLKSSVQIEAGYRSYDWETPDDLCNGCINYEKSLLPYFKINGNFPNISPSFNMTIGMSLFPKTFEYRGRVNNIVNKRYKYYWEESNPILLMLSFNYLYPHKRIQPWMSLGYGIIFAKSGTNIFTVEIGSRLNITKQFSVNAYFGKLSKPTLLLSGDNVRFRPDQKFLYPGVGIIYKFTR